MIIVNFKTYEYGTGERAVGLAQKLSNVNNNVRVVAAVQNADLYRISKEIEVFAQHIDPVDFGRNTGKDIAFCLKDNGASGVLINHSEDSINFKVIEECVAKSAEEGLEIVVCVPDIELAKKVCRMEPAYIAFEPPELIGGDVSVTSRPETVKRVVETVDNIDDNIKVLCGAGIKKGGDVRKAIELGAEGILVASGIVKTTEPGKKLTELVRAFRE